MDPIAKETCLRCGGRMELIKRDSIQLGSTGFLFGNLGNLLSGSLDVDIYACAGCGKIELYTAVPERENVSDAGPTEITCPRCGTTHNYYDLDCPSCGHRYKPGEFAPQSAERADEKPAKKKKHRDKPDWEF